MSRETLRERLEKLPRYWLRMKNAAESQTQMVCWVDVRRVLDEHDEPSLQTALRELAAQKDTKHG